MFFIYKLVAVPVSVSLLLPPAAQSLPTLSLNNFYSFSVQNSLIILVSSSSIFYVALSQRLCAAGYFILNI